MDSAVKQGVIATAGTAFNACMLLVHALKVPVLRYHPIERSWTFTATGGRVPMMYYGQVLWSLALAFAVGLVVLAVPARFWNKGRLMIAFGWLITSSILAVSYYVHANWP